MADFPAAVPLLPPLVPYTQADILALFDRLLPDHYLQPLKDPGPGYEYLQAVAKTIARVSEAIAHVGSGFYIGSATGGSYATVLVELYRDEATFGPVTLLGRGSAPQGTLVGTADGYTYQLMSDVTFGAGELGPKLVEARATARGWLWNQPGPFYTADGEFVEGPINRFIKPVFPLEPSPPNFDPTIKVRQHYRTASVRFTVTIPELDPILIMPGTILQTDQGIKFVTMDVATLPAGDAITNTVRARPLYPMTDISAWGTLDQIVSVVWGTTTQSAYLGVEQVSPWAPSDASGGVSPMLDGIGADRGIPRNFSGITSVTLARIAVPSPMPQLVVLPGTVLSTLDGFHYQTTSQVVFAVDDVGPHPVSVEPLFLNVQANLTQPISMVLSVRWGSQNTGALTVASSIIPVRETDSDYRTRLTFLPKTLTPNAIRNAINYNLGNLLAAQGKTFAIRETWDIRYQSAYDFPFTLNSYTDLDTANVNVPCPPYNSAVFVYDYVPLNEALSNRYLADNPERGVVVVRLPLLSNAQLQAQYYPALAASLEQIKPAGATMLYVLGDQ